MAYGHHDGLYRSEGRLGIKVNGDLGFGIAHEGTVGICFDVVFNGCDDLVCKVEAERQTALGFCGSVSKHNALVSRADLLFRSDGFIDFVALLTDEVDNRINGVAEFGSDPADDADVINICVGSDLTAEDDRIVLYHRFNAAMAVLVLGETLRQDGIGDLVGVFVGVVLTDLFCRKKSHFVFSLFAP